MKIGTLIIDDNERSKVYLNCLRSFELHRCRITLYTYDVKKIKNKLGESNYIDIVDASKILIRKEGKYDRHISLLSDHFRYEMLLREGGWWVDADTILLKKLPIIHKFLIASAKFKNESSPCINAIYLDRRFKNETKFISEVVEKARSLDTIDNFVEISSGYWYLIQNKLKSYIANSNDFNPYDMYEILEENCDISRLKESFILHCFFQRSFDSIGNKNTIIFKLLELIEKGIIPSYSELIK